jgi:hypothetical protein
MEILAFASFIALVVAWCVAPTRPVSTAAATEHEAKAA